MDSAKLRELVTIQQKTVSGTGDRGQPVYTWTTFASVFAEIEPLPPTGKKMEIARQLVATATHQITIRYLSGLTPQMRVQDTEGNTYQIGYVAHGENNLRYFVQIVLATVQESGI